MKEEARETKDIRESFYVSESECRALAELAEHLDIRRSQLFRAVILDYLQRHEAKEKASLKKLGLPVTD